MRAPVVTRVQYRTPPTLARNLEERIMVRFPGLWRTFARGLRLLKPEWRLRRVLLRRAVVSGWAAASRRDFELAGVRYAHDVEIEYDSDFEALGVTGPFRGREGWVKIVDALSEAWERWEMRVTVVLDLGDRVLVLGTVSLPANVSELALEREQAQLLTLRGALVAREQFFFAWDKGLRAAGLDPGLIIPPARGRSGMGTRP